MVGDSGSRTSTLSIKEDRTTDKTQHKQTHEKQNHIKAQTTNRMNTSYTPHKIQNNNSCRVSARKLPTPMMTTPEKYF